MLASFIPILSFVLATHLASGGARDMGVREAHVVRVALGAAGYEVGVSAEGGWALEDAWGRVHVRGRVGEAWRIERRNRRIRATTVGGDHPTAWTDQPFTLRASDSTSFVTWGSRRYRGALVFIATDSAILVVNYVDLEAYLRGVVPIEIGPRAPNEAAAVEAQAIAARSYTVVRMREGIGHLFDLSSAVTDQAYGGVGSEHPVSDAAIAVTAGLVLTYHDRVVRAPYHSACGGSTAAPSEIWRGGDEEYLRRVSDQIPGSERAWCEISPRFQWVRTFDRRGLEEAVARYMQSVGATPSRGGDAIRDARIEERTPSGRVAALLLDTDGGTVRMKGNDMRFAFRGVGGEILNSTYFSLEPVVGRDGRLMQLTLRGVGNGHGVGMCQWGAIGRARAGHDASEILAAYFPGTVLSRLP